MCVTSLLCGPRADLWPFYVNGLNRFPYKYPGTNPYILNVTQQCRCSPVLIFRAWATCALIRRRTFHVRKLMHTLLEHILQVI